MVVEIQLPVNRGALTLNGRTLDSAIDEANAELAKEAKKHFGAGRVTVGRLPDGRWFFHHLMLGTMVRIPDEFTEAAKKSLLHSILPAVKIVPVSAAEAVPEVHGIWARQSWADKFMAEERATIDVHAEEIHA